MIWKAQVLCDGEAEGEVVRLDAPISFWGGVSPETGCIVQAAHPQFGVSLRDMIIVIPEVIGSSSSAAVVLELIYQSIAPAGILMGQPDAILPIGAVVARQMGWREMPVLRMSDPPFYDGDTLRIEAGGHLTKLSNV